MIISNKIELTGNQFVDTGLGVISSIARLDNVNDLTLSKVCEVYGNGDQLTRWNSKLKSFTQIFGTNNPLYQYGYGFKKGKGPSELNKTIYKHTLEGLLSAMEKPEIGERCWACGSRSDFDFALIYKKAVEEGGKKAPENKVVGRDWFPLAGSLGSDAQSLPAASKPPHICPKCLFAVHYLPIGLILLNGRLAVFQSTSQEFWYDLVSSIVNENEKRINLGDYTTLGAKEGSRAFVNRLLTLFERLQRETQQDVPEALYVWRFTNSGASPDCSYEEVPNFALSFLQRAVKENLHQDIMNLLSSEGKRPQYSLYQSVLDRRDYSNLYPEGKRNGASPKLYALYQTYILNHSVTALNTAYKLAKTITEKTSEKEFKRMLRREAFREQGYRNRSKAIMVDMAEEGELTLEQYCDLFPSKEGQGVTVRWDGWNIIRFYLYHAKEEFPKIEVEHQPIPEVNQQLLYFASQIYNYYLNERGKDWFQDRILKQISRRVGTVWLRNQFVQLAEREPGFTYESWTKLCKLDDGTLYISELLFQMRVLWSQWIHDGERSVVATSFVAETTDGLSERVKSLAQAMFSSYVNQKGLNRFHRDILIRLRRKEIGECWFKEKLTKRISNEVQPLTGEEWEDFLIDNRGQNIRIERLFQLHLALANLYRANKSNREREVAQN